MYFGAATATDISNALKGYLPLSGGTLTGILKLKEIQNVGGYSLLVDQPPSASGITSSQWGVGTYERQGVIRSNNSNLLHYRPDGTVTIWDEANDGSGSGLDADLLDGKHASSFALSDHSHESLVITDNRSTVMLPNNVSTRRLSTFFNMQSNMPSTDWWSGITLMGWNSGYAVWQLAGQASSNNNNPYSLYFRTGINGSWNSWQRIALLGVSQTWSAYQDFTAGAGNSGSDMRFKELLGDNIGNVLSDVKNLNIFPYIWRKENETNWDTFGVNADLMLTAKNPIFHKMVHERDDVDKTKFVDYDRFGLIAIKAIQEITEIYEVKIKNLFDRIEKLESIIRNN